MDNPQEKIVVVGLTGGIASGKSTASRAFADLGVPVIDADQLARQVVAAGSATLEAIISAFGDDMLTSAGELDREALGHLVFRDAHAREALNRIIHPAIEEAKRQRVEALSSLEEPPVYCIYDAALLVETGGYRDLDLLVVMDTQERTQRERLKKRGHAEPEIEARLAAQSPLAEKLAVADYRLSGEGTAADLCAQVAQLHRAILEKLAYS